MGRALGLLLMALGVFIGVGAVLYGCHVVRGLIGVGILKDLTGLLLLVLIGLTTCIVALIGRTLFNRGLATVRRR